ncbi:relaxase/mobilization nuclease domain-containing protein [Actinosynnema sp. CA-248983]
MIAKVVRGYRPAGLIRYLFGPGKAEEHRNPRIVAAWDGATWAHQPEKAAAVRVDREVVEPGEFDFALGPLIETMQEWPRVAGLPLSTPRAITDEWAERVRLGDVPPDAPTWVRYYKWDARKKAVVLRPGYVWHTPVRLHPGDRTLSDEEWERIAERLMKATGIHQAGCRWIAVRHADDHIHLMATLVSEVTGKQFTPYRDFQALWKECQALERELGLTPTAGADKTAAVAPTRQEKGKAERLGRKVTARDELRLVVSQVAATTRNGEQFLRELKREGLRPQAVASEGRVLGYTVSLPWDRTKRSELVRYSGSKLAADLSWPKLIERWASVPPPGASERLDSAWATPEQRRTAMDASTRVVEHVVTALRTGAVYEDLGGIAHATGELLAALARGRERRSGGVLTDLVVQYDRATRTPHRVLPEQVGPLARELRQAARAIAAVGVLTARGNEALAAVALLAAMALLIALIAAWLQARSQTHQAAAASRVAPALAKFSNAEKARLPVIIGCPATKPVSGTQLQRPQVGGRLVVPNPQHPRGPSR